MANGYLFELPEWQGSDDSSNEALLGRLKRVEKYLYSLNEQLRYSMYNIDEDNLSPAFQQMLSASTGGMTSEIEVALGEIRSTVAELDGTMTQITQTVDDISFDVYDEEGHVAAEIELGMDGIEMTADDIKIMGTTTLADIFTSGTTTISGDHIDTGSIKLTEVYFKGSTTSYLYTEDGDIIMYPGAGGGDIYLGNPTSTVYTEGDLEVNGRFDADGLAKVWGEFYVVDYAEFSSDVSVGGQLSADHVWANSGEFEDWCWSPDWTNGSDRRIKHDIADLDGEKMAGFVAGLRPVKYRLDNDKYDRIRYGFIAQEVQEGLAQAGEDEDGAPIYRILDDLYGLNYSEFIAPMVSVIQNLTKRVEALEARLAAVEGGA